MDSGKLHLLYDTSQIFDGSIYSICNHTESGSSGNSICNHTKSGSTQHSGLIDGTKVQLIKPIHGCLCNIVAGDEYRTVLEPGHNVL